MEDLVSPEFLESRLGSYLFRLFFERNSWLCGESIGQVFRARGGTDLTPRLGSLKIPTLVINGEYDNSLPVGKRTAALVPGAIHSVLPKTGHACCIEDPAGFDELVIVFLRSQGLMPPVER
jgi:3-oxoadipate enol-lactonase